MRHAHLFVPLLTPFLFVLGCSATIDAQPDADGGPTVDDGGSPDGATGPSDDGGAPSREASADGASSDSSPHDAASDATPSCGLVCGGKCVDSARDPNNCGGCGVPPSHYCPVACVSGSCSADVVTGHFRTGASSSALIDTTLYWGATDQASTSTLAKIQSCPTSGCVDPATLVTLPSGQDSFGLAVDATNVYFSESGGSVMRCARAGCGGSPALVTNFALEPRQVATDGVNVYFAEKGAISYCPVAGCSGSPAHLFTGMTGGALTPYFFLVIDATTVYSVANGAVVSCAKAGCGGTPTNLTSGISNLNARNLTIDATSIYFQDGGGNRLLRCPKTGCAGAPTVLVTFAAGSGMVTDDMVVGATAIYWGLPFYGELSMCPLTGCPAPIRFANSGAVRVLGVDGTNVYTAGGNETIYRIPQ